MSTTTTGTRLPLIVAQYKLQGHPRRTEHWAPAALKDKLHAYIFQIVGGITNYEYKPSEHERFEQSQQLRGGCLVGYIELSHVGELREALKNVEVKRNDEEWDCQVWVVNALRELKSLEMDGLEIIEASEKAIRAELALEQVRWDKSEDVLEERLFP